MNDCALPAATCGARLPGGGRCARPSVLGKRRCLRHGGSARWGAPTGNGNARKHGAFTAAAKARRRAINAFLRDCWRAIHEIERREGQRAE